MNTLELSTLKRQWIDDSKDKFLSNEGEAFWFLKQIGEFTSDDIHRLHPLIPEPSNKNWYGALFAALKRCGLIERIGYKPSARKEANGRVIAVWRSKK